MLGVAPTWEGLDLSRGFPPRSLTLVSERNGREMSSTHPRSGIQCPLVPRRACPRDRSSACECPDLLLPLHWRGGVRLVWQKKTYLPCQVPVNLPVYAVSCVDGEGVRYHLHERHLTLTLPGMVQPRTRGLLTGEKTRARRCRDKTFQIGLNSQPRILSWHGARAPCES